MKKLVSFLKKPNALIHFSIIVALLLLLSFVVTNSPQGTLVIYSLILCISPFYSFILGYIYHQKRIEFFSTFARTIAITLVCFLITIREIFYFLISDTITDLTTSEYRNTIPSEKKIIFYSVHVLWLLMMIFFISRGIRSSKKITPSKG